MSIFKRLLTFIGSGSDRSVRAKRNILYSFANKGLAIIISLLLVPATLNYLDTEQYGIWLTLSSIVTWISFFDVGLSHGFRNKFAEARANNNNILARQYVSTTYLSMIVIFGLVLIVFECINPFINWASLLNVSSQYRDLLSSVVSFILIGICVQFITNVFSIMLSADQKPAVAAFINTLGQGAALVIIFILTLLPKHNMLYIATALSWVPVSITVFASVVFYLTSYRSFAPSIHFYDSSLIKNILNLGLKFFVIQISQVIIIHLVNIILSRELGPTSVTEYNITYKYFSITMMIFSIVLSPYWTAFTDAYTKSDFAWMTIVERKLSKTWSILFLVSFIFLILSPFIYKVWLNDSIEISAHTSIAMFLYISIWSYSNMQMILINGTGKITLQMYIYVCCAMFSIPSSIFLCRYLGLVGIIINLSLIFLLQAIFAKMQLKKILSNSASGIWNK